MPLRIREKPGSPVIATYRSLCDDDLSLETLLSELEAPSARLLEATALFLVEWVKTTEPDLRLDFAHPDALRRFGFIADRIGQTPDLEGPVRDRLSRIAETVFQALGPAPFDDLGFSSTTSETRIRRLQRRADDTARRWKVWGVVELREEFLE